MAQLVYQLIEHAAQQTAANTALLYRRETLDYAALWHGCASFGAGLGAFGVAAGDRVATYLPKQPEAVIAMFGASAAGCVMVPVNPVLKARQVAHILSDCNVRVLVTSVQRLKSLEPLLHELTDLQAVVVVDGTSSAEVGAGPGRACHAWPDFMAEPAGFVPRQRIDADMAAILYTSGSTGKPKGVVLSHRNMLAGAESVASYLENTSQDRVLALLPLSFDAGLSQLTTMFHVGGSAVLFEYLLPGDVLKALERHEITGLAAVPPIWNQLAGLEWPAPVVERLRYITNTGGAMPRATTATLVAKLPSTRVYLMYGLTEAFRSTYLDPAQVTLRPDSIGKAIPNAEVMVINENGEECGPDEPGELVHRGALVAMGYWNAPELTAERFRPAPGRPAGLCVPELAVWSGDRVRKDGEGYLYFVSRADEMIKTSGYRVSPTEVEEVVYAAANISQVAALGLPHAMLGQAILVVACPGKGADISGLGEVILLHCKKELPLFMVPLAVEIRAELPLNQNGKLDRKGLAAEYGHYFQE